MFGFDIPEALSFVFCVVLVSPHCCCWVAAVGLSGGPPVPGGGDRPTAVVAMSNIITRENALNDEEYQDIIMDIKQE